MPRVCIVSSVVHMHTRRYGFYSCRVRFISCTAGCLEGDARSVWRWERNRGCRLVGELGVYVTHSPVRYLRNLEVTCGYTCLRLLNGRSDAVPHSCFRWIFFQRCRKGLLLLVACRVFFGPCCTVVPPWLLIALTLIANTSHVRCFVLHHCSIFFFAKYSKLVVGGGCCDEDISTLDAPTFWILQIMLVLLADVSRLITRHFFSLVNRRRGHQTDRFDNDKNLRRNPCMPEKDASLSSALMMRRAPRIDRHRHLSLCRSKGQSITMMVFIHPNSNCFFFVQSDGIRWYHKFGVFLVVFVIFKKRHMHTSPNSFTLTKVKQKIGVRPPTLVSSCLTPACRQGTGRKRD